jgi:putative ABC transport system permease protein
VTRLWRFVTGPAGPGPVTALAVVAMLAVFVGAAGPREVTVLQNGALRQTIAAAGPFSVLVQTSYTPTPVPLYAGGMQLIGQQIGNEIQPPLDASAGRSWSGFTTPFKGVANPAPKAVLSGPPDLELAYRSDLTSYARLVSGSFPNAVTYTEQAGQRVPVLQGAVTKATAARLGLRIGSDISLSSPQLPPGYPPEMLQVTGIISPTDPGGSFWTNDPSLAAPTISASRIPIWQGGALVGPAELPAIEAGAAGTIGQLYWDYPLDTASLTSAQVSAWLRAATTATTNVANVFYNAGALPPGVNESPGVSVFGAGVLSDFQSQQAALGTTDSLLVTGLAAVALILLLVCAAAVAGAYAAELTLVRARGATTGQAAARVAARTALAGTPALAAGALLAVVATPGGATPAAGGFAAAVAVTTLAAPTLVAAWQHRGQRGLASGGGRGDLAIRRRSARRVVAEIAAGIAIIGAVVALRQRGLAPGAGVDPYTSAVPVLVALGAGLIAARVYPVPLRLLLRLSSRRRAAAGYLALARAARAGSGSVLPALALVVAVAVIALGGMVRSAVSRGQVAASWQQVGADAVVSAGGAHLAIDPAQQAAMTGVPGVRHSAAAYVIAPGSSLSANLLVGVSGTLSAGVVIADPARYAAVTADTPWPSFPGRLLARRGPGGTVPVIASPRVAAAVRAGANQLAFASSQITIRVAGTVTGTPALPAGGSFIIMPAWASSLLQANTQPNTMLLTGAGINVHDLQQVARGLPGSQVTSRAAVLRAAANAPSVQGSDLLFVLAAASAGGCAAAAVLLGLLLSARHRTQLAAWLTAMGMTGRQFQRLAVLDALPLLLIALVGGELAGLILGPLIGPALDLSAFTGSGAPVRVLPDAGALIAPAAGAIILVAVVTAGRSALTRSRAKTAVLRLDEGR